MTRKDIDALVARGLQAIANANGEGYSDTTEDDLRVVFEDVLPILSEDGPQPDRRAELLELASRLVASPWKEAWETGTIRGELNRTTEDKRKAVFELVARDSTLMAAAIIAEVDRVSGEVKP